MKIKKKLLLTGMALCCRYVDAEPQVLHVLDSVCVEDQARQCFDHALPPKTGGTQNPAPYFGWTCPLGYTVKGGECYRALDSPKAAETWSATLQACELNARVQYSASCIKTIPVDEFMTTLRDDMRKLLSQFCKTYATPADIAKCDALNGPPPPAQ